MKADFAYLFIEPLLLFAAANLFLFVFGTNLSVAKISHYFQKHSLAIFPGSAGQGTDPIFCWQTRPIQPIFCRIVYTRVQERPVYPRLLQKL